jgi:hypothetical protein
MPTMELTRTPSGVTPPELGDPSQFVCRPGVPAMDTHTRRGRVVDEPLLRLVCENTARRIAVQEYPLVLIGHTDDHGKEREQPDLVGYVGAVSMGSWRGNPCILADIYFARERMKEALGYPRRSVEVYYSEEPSQNYIDILSLMVRSPERDLGLVTYAKTRERYALELEESTVNTASEAISMEEIPTLVRYMKDKGHGLETYMDGLAAYKADRKAKNAVKPVSQPVGDILRPDELATLVRYCKVKGFGPDRYQEGLAAYKATRQTVR